MYNINIYLEKLDNTQNKKGKCDDINSLIENLNFYESFIPDFFSKNGEANGIKSVYREINKNLDNENKINCINVLESADIYKDYLSGMVTFINDINNSVITESCDELKLYEDKFEKAREKDSAFINSLYNGRLNSITEMNVSEAVSNLEYLIAFIPELGSMKNTCINLNESFNEEQDERKKTLLNNSLTMLYESVDNYCYSTIKNIITTYNNINESLFNKDDKTVKEIKYKLF